MAFGALKELRRHWQQHRHDAPGGLGQPRAPQRVRQPTKRKIRRQTKAKTRKRAQTAHAATETALSQPDLLLTAIRAAQQSLMIEDLRQISGVDGGRLKRNVSRLVAQGKIQETPAGYVVVSTQNPKGSSGRDASHEAFVAHYRDDDTIVTAISEG